MHGLKPKRRAGPRISSWPRGATNFAPLTPVLMAVHTLARHDDLSEELRQTFAMIRRNIEVEVKLMDDLLDLTRISRGTLEIVQEPLQLHAVIHDALQIVIPDLEARQLPLKVMLGAAETRVVGDAMRLQQVFWNLLKNAAKFSPRGGAISIRSWNERDRILVAVSDSGIGFEPDVVERVFESFVQGSHDITRRFGGLVLGWRFRVRRFKPMAERFGRKVQALSEERPLLWTCQ